MSAFPLPKTGQATAGFTLLEMVVVLVILAVIAQTAVVALDNAAADQWRLSTIDALEAAEDAILGRPHLSQPGGLPWIQGFVADVGRLPRVTGDAPLDQGEWCRELWARGALPQHAVQVATGDAEVQLPGGWRGPYLRLGVGQQGWFDGFGVPFQPLDPANQAAVDGDSIFGIRSGAEIAGADEVEDLVMSVRVDGIDRHLGDVPVNVLPAPGGGALLVVRIYGPQEGKIVTLSQQSAPASGSVFVVFEDIPIGHRALRAYQTDVLLPANQQAPIPDAITSVIVPLAVVAGGTPVVDIDMSGV